MNKKIALAALILSAGFALTACTPNNENAQANKSPSSQVTDEQTTTTVLDDSEITTTSDSETTDNNSNAEGGNSDIANYIEVTVSEDKYFYENHEISYDDLIKVFDELDGNTAVKINDENATLNAYEALTKALEEREILYEAAN